MGIGATLHVCPDGRLDGFVPVSGNLLKFINGHQTGFICFAQIGENLIQGNRRVFNRAKTHSPDRQSTHIKRDFTTQRRHHVHKLLPSLPAFETKLVDQCLTQHVHKIAQILGGINVHHKTMIILLYLRIIEHMPNEICLSYSSGRNQRDIVLVDKKFSQNYGLLGPVTKILGTGITIGNKGVFHRAILFHPQKYKNFDYRKMITIK